MIEREQKQGVVGGPLVLIWVDRLLAGWKARFGQLRYLQKQMRQAFKYLVKCGLAACGDRT